MVSNSTRAQANGIPFGKSCTIVYASDETAALAGNNEDGDILFSKVWFRPARNGKFGMVLFGFDVKRFPQGGMNEKGLFYDAAATEPVVVPRDSGKPLFEGNLMLKAMEECSTVEEVLRLFEHYNVAQEWSGHLLVGDRIGNSAVIEPLTFIRKQGKHQIVTNFLQSKTKPEDISCARYRLATELFRKSKKPSIDLIRQILNATHAEDYSDWMSATQYSYICDLKPGEIYLYNFHDFENVVKINLREELKKGENVYSILSLFPYETFAETSFKNELIVRMLYNTAVADGVDGEKGAITLYREINPLESRSIPSSVTEKQLRTVGLRLLEKGKLQEAIGMFTFYASEYPQAAKAYSGLGEAFLKTGDRESAIRHWEKALMLDPADESARKGLQELKEKK